MRAAASPNIFKNISSVTCAEQELETSLGDYKEVAGVYMPHSAENGVKGSPNKSQINFEKIEANVTLDDGRFKQPAVNQNGGKKE